LKQSRDSVLDFGVLIYSPKAHTENKFATHVCDMTSEQMESNNKDQVNMNHDTAQEEFYFSTGDIFCTIVNPSDLVPDIDSKTDNENDEPPVKKFRTTDDQPNSEIYGVYQIIGLMEENEEFLGYLCRESVRYYDHPPSPEELNIDDFQILFPMSVTRGQDESSSDRTFVCNIEIENPEAIMDWYENEQERMSDSESEDDSFECE
jgi:hypothetical protein